MINTQKLNELHPTLQRGIKELFRRMLLINSNWKPALTCAYRGREEQEKAYREGNSTLRFGQSLHNFIPSTAFDIHNNIRGQEFSDKNFFKQAGRIWEEMGGEWGGSWKGFVDMPHFQFTNGRPIKDITSKKYVMPNDTKMKWELNSDMGNHITTTNPANISNTSDAGIPVTTNKEKYMLRDIKILVDGKEIIIPAILFNDQNYIKIQDLGKIDTNFSTSWDNEKRMPIIKTK